MEIVQGTVKNGGIKFEDSAFGTWCIMDDEIAGDLDLPMPAAEAAIADASLLQDVMLPGAEDDSPRDGPDSGADLPRAVPVELSQQCQTEYEKIAKKGDSKLIALIDKTLDDLKADPYLGKKLTENLKGENSIVLHGHSYRILYRIQKLPSPVVVVLSMGHRRDVYDRRARRSASQKSVPP